MTTNENTWKFAILIDSENISSGYAQTIFDEISKYGSSPERRIYGDWEKDSKNKNSWDKTIIVDYALTAVQQFAYTSSKNSTDMALVIDAMDILYKDKVDAFCIVTGDSDFTRLVTRLRADGKFVIGMGGPQSAQSLIKACDKFLHLDLIRHDDQDTDESSEKPDSLTNTIRDAVLDIVGDSDGDLDLSRIGSELSKRFPDFDTRNYGYTKLSKFLQAEFKDTLELKQVGGRWVIGKNLALTEKKLRDEITEILKKNGGQVDSVGKISDKLKKNHPDFNVHDFFGYSHISTYLKSCGIFKVNGNTVKLIETKVPKK